MKISVISPVKNESQFIGYSIMAVLPYIHEIIYSCAKSTDGTDELLDYIKDKYAKDKLIILRKPAYDFDVHDMTAYNKAYNECIDIATGEAIWFLHPDMLCLNPEVSLNLKEGPLAWWTNLTCYAGDFQTKITTGRAYAWKNIHVKKFGLHYYGGYGSENEDFYFSDITGKSHLHYGSQFRAYPYKVADSCVRVNHYCELKNYKRRFEKMKYCLKTLYPNWSDEYISEMAAQHPRVTLEPTTKLFGNFTFEKTNEILPEIISKYKREFDSILKHENSILTYN